MKNIYFLVALVTISAGSFAQSYTGNTKIRSMNKMAVIYELPYEEEITAEAIKKKMSQLSYTSKNEKDFMVFKNVSLSNLGPATYNLYFKAERKSRKEKDKSMVYLLVSDTYDAFLNETNNNAVIENAKTFLNTLNVQAEDVFIESEITKHQEEVKKAEKEYENSVNDGNGLEKKRADVEEEIKKNKEQQEQRRQEVEKQKQQLDEARAKRKNQ